MMIHTMIHNKDIVNNRFASDRYNEDVIAMINNV